QALAPALKALKAGAQTEAAKPNAVATAATTKDITSPVVKPDHSVAGKGVDSTEIPGDLKQEVKQNNAERSVRAEAQELAASRGAGAEKADPRTVAAARAESNVNARPDMNPQAVAAQAAGEARSLKSGDQKLVTSGIEGKSNASAQGLASMAPQASLRTGSAAHAEVKTPVNQPGFAKELGQKITWAIGKNLSTVDIRVNPEQMGTLNMRILQRGQNIQLVIRTSDETSGAMLQQAIAGLKETMGQNGLQLNQVQIHSGNNSGGAQPQFGQNMQGQSQQQGGAQQQPSGGQGQGQQSASAEADMPAAQSTRTQSPDSNLDLFA
ncbi:MAG: flagellar hook-length control protein FliK, partial [Limnobacter sp.]|nr:flagellar hook-length control protein FliK [Limnobacter sp.]